MERNYLLVGIASTISGVFIFLLFLFAFLRYHQRRTKIAESLTKMFGFFLISISFYSTCSFITYFDPWGYSYQFQVMIFAFVFIFQVLGYYYFWRLSKEIWDQKEITKKENLVVQLVVSIIIIYLFLGAVMGYGHIPFGENNNELIIESYIIIIVYQLSILLKAIGSSMRLYRKMKKQISEIPPGESKIEMKIHYFAVININIFFFGILLFNIIALLVDALFKNEILYLSTLFLLPLFCFIGFNGLFLPDWFKDKLIELAKKN
jgi:hypothetical protein